MPAHLWFTYWTVASVIALPLIIAGLLALWDKFSERR